MPRKNYSEIHVDRTLMTELRNVKKFANKRKMALSKKYIQERRKKLVELWTAGCTYQMIVEANIGYRNVGHVSGDLKAIRKDIWIDNPEDIVVLDLQRLNEFQRLCTMDLRMNGNTSQIDRLMRIMSFRHSLLGITPERIEQERVNRSQVVNNGIMVVQGSTEHDSTDYVKSMMRAAGLSEQAAQREIEKLKNPEKQKAITAKEMLEAENMSQRIDLQPLPALPHIAPADVTKPIVVSVDVEKLKESLDAGNPIHDLHEPKDLYDQQNIQETENPRIIKGEIVEKEENETSAKKKIRLRVRVNTEGENTKNREVVSGVPYKAAPRKIKIKKEMPIYDDVDIEEFEERI